MVNYLDSTLDFVSPGNFEGTEFILEQQLIRTAEY